MTFDDMSEQGLGLASAPGTEIVPPMKPAGFDATRVEMPAGMKLPEGLGLSSQRTQADEDYLQSLPTAQKIGLALQSFSAGVAGRESPIEKLLAQKRQNDKEARAELANTAAILTKGFEEARKYGADTLAGKAVLGAYKRLLPAEFATALDTVGTDMEEGARSLAALVSDPDVRESLIKSCGRDRACWQKQVNDKDWLSMQYAGVDTKRMAGALPKLRAFREQVIDKGGLGARETEDGKFELTWPEFIEGNAKLQLFSEAEMDTFRRNPEHLIPYGIKTVKAISAGEVTAENERVKRAFKEEKQPQTTNVGGTVYQFDPDKKLTGARLASDPRYAALGPTKGPREGTPDVGKFTNIESDGKGGFIGFNRATGRIEQIPQDEGVVPKEKPDPQAQTHIRSLSGEYERTAKTPRGILELYGQYQNARGSGDYAQAAQAMSHAIQQMMRSGYSRQFKGEGEKVLGGGYGGGNIFDRFQNFVSTELSKGGTPTNETLAKLDRIAAALAKSGAANLAEDTKRIHKKAQARKVDPVAVLGGPQVYGNVVILPTGQSKFFKTNQQAQEVADAWERENGGK